MSRWIECSAGVLLIVLYGACGATPVPDPPDLDPPELEDTTAESVVMLVGGTATTIEGAPGSAPPGATVHVVRLSGTETPALALAREDGGYSMTITAEMGEELRLSFRSGESRSAPVDGVVPTTGPGPLTPVRREPCVTVDPPLELGLDDAEIGGESIGTIVVTNGCDGPITIATRLRAPSIALTAGAPIEATIAAGGSTSFDVTLAPSAAGMFEEIVFADVTGAIAESYPITVFGVAR
jgi:hypothetical protein